MDHSSGANRGAAVPSLAGLTALLARAACWICVALFAAILITMVLQVAFRYVLATPLTWTEELARYLYIWACWVGAPVAMRRGNHIAIAFVQERLPGRLARLIGLATQAAALKFGDFFSLRIHRPTVQGFANMPELFVWNVWKQ